MTALYRILKLEKISPLVLYGLACFPVLLQSLNAKKTLLNVNGGGYELIAQMLGKSNIEQLDLWEKFTPYINDIIFSGIILPLFVLALISYLGSKLKATTVAFIVISLSLMLFIQMKCYWNVGSFLPLSVLIAGVTDQGKMFIQDYLQFSSLVKLAILISLSLLMISTAYFVDKRSRSEHLQSRTKSSRLFLALLIFGSVGWSSLPVDNGYSKSILSITALYSAGLYEDVAVADYETIPPENFPDKFKEMTNTIKGPKNSRYWQKAKDYDVIFFILESTPEQCTDFTNPKIQLPNINGLISESFISKNHYSTYPYTVRALMSLYSSWYPSNNSTDFIKMHDAKGEALIAPGVVRSARNAGYKTAVFVPEYTDNWEHDKQRYEALGFDKQWFPNESIEYKSIPRGDVGWRAITEQKDVFILNLLKKEISISIVEGRQYLFAFQPQYTHGPWPNITPAFTLEETIAECTKLMETVDQWVGEVLAVVENHDRLDQTLIVITGDHGIRTKTEHPGFNSGVIDGISFNVPLLIFAPNVLRQTTVISSVSSHIDIAPTVLDLMGISSGREYEQGLPLWDPNLEKRYTFFFAKHYLGADAYYFDDTVSTIKYLFNLAWENPSDGSLTFKNDLENAEKTDKIASKLANITEFQNKWSSLLLPSTLPENGPGKHAFDTRDN